MGGSGGATAKQSPKKSKKKSKKKSMDTQQRSRSQRAGLQFPVARIETQLRKALPPGIHVGGTAAVFLASVVEYLSAEVLELAGKAAKDNNRARINPRFLKLAVGNDDELNNLLPGHIMFGGVIPHIHPKLIPKSKKKKKKKQKGKEKLIVTVNA